MIFLSDSSESNEVVAAELRAEVGQLITPLTKRTNRGGLFGIDNGAFAKFEAETFRRILKRELPNRARCKFVAAPDVDVWRVLGVGGLGVGEVGWQGTRQIGRILTLDSEKQAN